jgi:hypothetical protein
MIDIRTNTDKTLDFLSQKFESGELDNNSLVQIIELCGTYLGVSTISALASKKGKSYNGIKKTMPKIKIFGKVFVVTNQ